MSNSTFLKAKSTTNYIAWLQVPELAGDENYIMPLLGGTLVTTDSVPGEVSSALSTWVGSTNIATLGTITTGTWHGNSIDDSYISSASTWNAIVSFPGFGATGSLACVGNDARLSDARTPVSHTLASHIVTGLTTGHFLKATGADTYGFAAHGLTYSDVGALASNGTAADSSKLNNQSASYYQTAYTILGTLGALSNSAGYLYNDGAGVLSYSAVDVSGALAAFTGSSNIVTLGTITSGVWNGTAIDDSYISSASTWNALTTFPGFGNTGSTACVGNDARLSDARTPTSHALSSHTVTGLTTGHFLKATGADTFDFGAHGLTYTDVGAAASSHTQAVSSISDATTVGQNVVKLANPSAITFPRFNADNTVSALSASDFRTAIGAGSYDFTLSGTAGQTYTLPSTTATIARTDASNTFTGRQLFSDTTQATTGLDGALQTDGGLSVVKAAVICGDTTISGVVENVDRSLYIKSPSAKTSSIYVQGNDITGANGLIIQHASDESTKFWSCSNKAMQFGVNNATALTIAATSKDISIDSTTNSTTTTTGSLITAGGIGAVKAIVGGYNATFNGITVGKPAGSDSVILGVSNARGSATRAVAIGHEALYSNTSSITHNDSVFIGYRTAYVLARETDSSQTLYAALNTCVGSETLRNSVSGVNSTCIGYRAGYSATKTLNCTFLGSMAGYSATESLKNTCIGFASGKGLIGASSKFIISFSDYSATVAGTVKALTSGVHGYTTGDVVSIAIYTGDSTYAAYNKCYSITVIDTTSFYFTETFTSNYNGRCQVVSTGAANNILIGANCAVNLTTGGGNVVIGTDTVASSSSMANNIILATGQGTIRYQFDGTDTNIPTDGGKLKLASSLELNTLGKSIGIKTGSNAKAGVATLVSGTVTVSTTAVATASMIFLTIQSLGTVSVPKPIAVTARVNATSFTITSSDATDTSVVAWWIVDSL